MRAINLWKTEEGVYFLVPCFLLIKDGVTWVKML